MDIDITDFFNECSPMVYSASRAEIGDNAGAVTWRAACDDAPDWPLLDTDAKRQAFREYVRSFGAWTDDEIAAWTNVELTALFIQMVSGDMREFEALTNGDWFLWGRLANDGTVGGNLFGGPLSVDGRVYYSIG